MVRHGESIWNQMNLFTGWVDVPLSARGIEEALNCGEQIKNLPIDIIFTSTLNRAIMTAMVIMTEHHSQKVPVIEHKGQGKLEEWARINSEKAKKQTIPVICAWELNERMYGDLQGLNKSETAEIYGTDQVQIWRRSFEIPPPNGESLAMTAGRTIPYFEMKIVPCLEIGQNVMISAHGNSLRSIMMDIDQLSAQEVVNLELGTGVPYIYNFEKGKFKKES